MGRWLPGTRLLVRLVCMAATLSMTLTACQAIAALKGGSVTPKSADADCRFGPGTGFSTISTLRLGETAKILGTVSDQSWWQIKDPQTPGTKCWVPGPAVTSSGDISRVPVLSIPSGLVTALTISGPAVIHSPCDDDTTNPASFKISITTNGPAKVTYHLEVYNKDGTMLLVHSKNASLDFPSASTYTVNSGDVIDSDCGDFFVKAIADSPNSMTAQTSWSVVSP
jgi:uncharacterized protein YraI